MHYCIAFDFFRKLLIVQNKSCIFVPNKPKGGSRRDRGAWVRDCYNSNMWLKYYNKMTDDDKNMLPLKRISFLGNNG